MARDLAKRATNRGAARNNGGGAPATLSDQIRSMESQFAMAMPKGAEAAQLVRDALTSIRQTPQLAECEAPTVLGALMTCAQLGLRPGVLGHAYLLPFWDGKSRSRKAQLVLGYQGLLELAYRSGQVESVAARTVYSNDEFDLSYELTGDRMVHRPCLDGLRGEPRLYYAVARMKGGGYAITNPMTHAEMEAYRDKNATAKTKDGRVVGPWRDHFEGMAHKTMIRQLSKLLPKGTDLATALEADERVRVDLSPGGIEHADYIDGEAVDAAPPAAGPDVSDAVEMVTDAQLKKLHAQLGEIGVTDDESRHRELSQIVGRQVVSARDLTIDEASVVIEALTAATSQGGAQ